MRLFKWFLEVIQQINNGARIGPLVLILGLELCLWTIIQIWRSYLQLLRKMRWIWSFSQRFDIGNIDAFWTGPHSHVFSQHPLTSLKKVRTPKNYVCICLFLFLSMPIRNWLSFCALSLCFKKYEALSYNLKKG